MTVLPPEAAAVFGDPPTLETERLVLRKFRPADAGDIFEYASDPRVAHFVPWDAHSSIEESRAFVQRILASYGQRPDATWVIVLKAAEKVIGTIRLGNYSAVHRRADVGYAIGRQYWGQGYTTEALRAVLALGFDRLGVNRIWAICDINNFASERVMQKVGMRLEGVLREQMFEKGEFRDVKLYAVLRREWSAASAEGAVGAWGRQPP